LCASGWHIAALATRLVIETLLDNGLPFVEMTSVSQLKWSQPTFVNDQIRVRVTLAKSDEDSPITNTRCQTLEIEVCNSNGAVVATMTASAAIASEPALTAST
jgi:acyl dehydratase